VHSREESVETKLQRIADKAKREPGFKFSRLFHLMNEELLLGCFERLRNNAASGIDEVTKEQYAEQLEGNVQQLVTRWHRMAYIPQPVMRIYIPKMMYMQNCMQPRSSRVRQGVLYEGVTDDGDGLIESYQSTRPKDTKQIKILY